MGARAGGHGLCQPASRAVGKWREKEKMKRKWRENEEIERKWNENEEMEGDLLSASCEGLGTSSFGPFSK